MSGQEGNVGRGGGVVSCIGGEVRVCLQKKECEKWKGCYRRRIILAMSIWIIQKICTITIMCHPTHDGQERVLSEMSEFALVAEYMIRGIDEYFRDFF